VPCPGIGTTALTGQTCEPRQRLICWSCNREEQPDARGYVAHPVGATFVDGGVARFSPSINCSASHPGSMRNGSRSCPTFKAASSSDLAKRRRPYPDFVKAYGPNGYFKSLKTIVHFYNTRDVLPRCQPKDPGEGTTCWPASESTANMNTKLLGRLGLSRRRRTRSSVHADADRWLHACRRTLS
jgi:cytochrome c peroxidase